MILTERHFIEGTDEIIELCKCSAQLYNRCNYLMRQCWFNNRHSQEKINLPSVGELIAEVREEECYKNLHNTKTACQTIRRVWTDWMNFFKALKAYGQDPSKFTSRPKPPGYKKKLAQVIFFNETIFKKFLKQGLIVPTNSCFAIKSDREYKQVKITPKTFGFIIEVSYEAPEQEKVNVKNEDELLCIDLGLNNLCAITLDQQQPILINGRIVKSINHYYNKHKCKRTSRKRYFRLENYFHHASKYIVELCVLYQIGKIVIGRNKHWKNKINLGKQTNQAFCSIPYENLIQKIKYKAEQRGIEVVITEEAYTSKSSFYDRDPLPIYQQGVKHTFSGNRKCRGLYITKDGFAVNADVNGSLNCGRKVFPEFLGIRDKSLAARPVIINPLRQLNATGGRARFMVKMNSVNGTKKPTQTCI